MADIPVERKGGFPGWLWLVLALLLALLLFLLLGRGCGNDADDVVAPDTSTAYVAPAPVDNDGLDFTGDADISSIDDLFARAAAGSIVGSTVRLSDVLVSNVVGDSTFYVTNGSERAMVVLEGLGESQSNMGAADGRYAIHDGDTLDIMGRVAALDGSLQARYGGAMEGAASDYYIRARRVTE